LSLEFFKRELSRPDGDRFIGLPPRCGCEKTQVSLRGNRGLKDAIAKVEEEIFSAIGGVFKSHLTDTNQAQGKK
jgi:hypothetical protein